MDSQKLPLSQQRIKMETPRIHSTHHPHSQPMQSNLAKVLYNSHPLCMKVKHPSRQAVRNHYKTASAVQAHTSH